MTLAFPPLGDDRPYDADAVERFPWPAVAGYDDVHHWMGDGQAVHAAWQLRDVWESLIRFLGCVALGDCHTHQPAATGPAVQAVRLRIPGQETLDLTPLLSVQRCAVCDQWSAFTLDKTRPARRSAQFLELLAGHILGDRGHARLSEWLG